MPFLEAARERGVHEADVLADQFAAFHLPAGARVLDVGCGIGRHSVPLALKGCRVVGFDLSPLFLERARELAAEAGADIRLVGGDARSLENSLGGEAPFQAFINMFTSHGYYGEEDDLRFFQSLRRLAAPGAALILETLNRDYILRNFQPIGIEEAGGVQYRDERRLNLETSTLENVWSFYERRGDDLKLRLRLEMEMRIYSLHEMRRLLDRAGWRFVRSFTLEPGGPGTRPVTPDSFRMWIAARNGEG